MSHCRAVWEHDDDEISLDEVYLDGELVLYPLAADDVAGWVQFYRADQDGGQTDRVETRLGHVDIVRSLDCDPFAEDG